MTITKRSDLCISAATQTQAKLLYLGAPLLQCLSMLVLNSGEQVLYNLGHAKVVETAALYTIALSGHIS